MGYARPDVQAAMIAAFMNPDRAVQYLEEGLPDAGGEDAAMDEDDGGAEGAPTPTTWAELEAQPQFRGEISRISDQGALQSYLQQLASTDPAKLALIQSNPTAFAELLNQAQSAGGNLPPVAGAPVPAAAPLPFGMAAAGGGGGGGGGLPPGLQQMMATNPQMLEGLLQNPEMLAQLLQVPEIQQAMQNPEVMEQLGLSPEMMQAMLGGMMAGGGGGGGAPHPVLSQLTPEDEEAIERLMALGFPRPIVIQAFLACEKNENLAANFLFDQGGDLM